MAVTLNASTSTGYIQTADTSGDLALQSNGTTQFTVSSTGAYGQIKSGTAVASTSGTAIDFTSIPSWVKRITVMFSAVSLSGSSRMQIQLGDSGGFETTGYVGTYEERSTTTNVTALTNGFIVSGVSSGYALNGFSTINLLGSNIWTFSANMASDPGRLLTCCGAKTLSDTLTQVRITTVNGTDTFDAGTINILYEG